MTTGIYKLNFKGTDKVYIGQSSNIAGRFAMHCYAFRDKSASKKLQAAYDIYGYPELEILVECIDQVELDESEDAAIELYDSVVNGFNTLNKSNEIPKGYGELNGRSRHSNKKVEEVFFLLISDPNILFKSISELLLVPQDLVRRISSGSNHSWLATKYPEEYAYLMSLKHTRKSHSRVLDKLLPPIVSPEGEVHTIQVGKVREFCESRNLDRSHLGNVLKGKEKQHKGWKLYNE